MRESAANVESPQKAKPDALNVLRKTERKKVDKMKEFDLNVTASQIIRIKAETEEEAVQEAFHESFGHGREAFATTEYDLVSTSEIEGERGE